MLTVILTNELECIDAAIKEVGERNRKECKNWKDLGGCIDSHYYQMCKESCGCGM